MVEQLQSLRFIHSYYLLIQDKALLFTLRRFSESLGCMLLARNKVWRRNIDFQAFKTNIKILDREAGSEIRERYIENFINTSSSRYYEMIQQRHKFQDGYCYLGYLGDYLKNPKELAYLKNSLVFKRSIKVRRILMEAKELNRLLIDRFPELEKKYHDEVDWQEGNETGSHVVYGDVLAPYLETAIAKNNQEVLEKIFVFVEEILNQREEYSDEVIMFSVLERILYDKEQVRSCRRYFGEITEKVIKEMRQ